MLWMTVSRPLKARSPRRTQKSQYSMGFLTARSSGMALVGPSLIIWQVGTPLLQSRTSTSQPRNSRVSTNARSMTVA